MRVRLSMGCTFTPNRRKDIVDLPDETTNEELDKIWQDWAYQSVDGTWQKLEDEEEE